MPKTSVTIQDVAEKAGVSMTTVSFVLNNKTNYSITAETRERVLNAVRELKYVQNAAGKRLASGKSHTIGFVMPYMEHLKIDVFIPRLLFSLNDICINRGFNLLIRSVEDSMSAEAYIKMAISKEIDGLFVLNPRPEDTWIDTLLDLGFPVIADPYWHNSLACGVGFDDEGLGVIATSHLLERGRKHIACINYGPENFFSVARRFNGYRKSLDNAGIPFDPSIVRWANFSIESGYQAALDLLQSGARFDAVFAGNDTIAIGVIAALRDRGIRIPDDIAIVGIDDISISKFLDPPLSTVQVQADAFGRLVGEMLIDLINDHPPKNTRVLLSGALVVRKST